MNQLQFSALKHIASHDPDNNTHYKAHEGCLGIHNTGYKLKDSD